MLDRQDRLDRISIICFDADDTLWLNEPFFVETEKRFCELLAAYGDADAISREHFRTESANIPFYGYGVKGYTLSMIETALRLSGGRVDSAVLAQFIDMGKELLDHPLQIMDGVRETLAALRPHYRLVVATKGDLLDQERKLEKSALRDFFHHVEIMSNKTEAEYRRLLRHLDIDAGDFLMVGNSIKSDILPVLACGGYAVHIPFTATWLHEHAEAPDGNSRFFALDRIDALPSLLGMRN